MPIAEPQKAPLIEQYHKLYRKLYVEYLLASNHSPSYD